MSRARLRWVSLAAVLVGLGVSSRASAQQYFAEVPNGLPPCSPGGCYTNYLRVTDIDGDGDLDALLPNGNNQTEPFKVYLNGGNGTFTDGSAMVVGGYSAALRQIAVGDVDGDKDLDVYVPTKNGAPNAFFFNEGGVLTDQAAAHLPGVSSRSEATRFADVDDDGDLDLFIAETQQVAGRLYLNDGAGNFAEAAGQVPQVAPEEANDIDFLDADGDFDLDLLINNHGSPNDLWLNDGAGNFTDAMPNFPNQNGGLHYGPGVCDVDGDGDLDIWVDNMGPNYTEQLLINDGAGHFADETTSRVSGNPGSDDNGIVCADVDGDGDLDAIVMALGGGSERLLVNDGTGHFTYSAGAFSNAGDSTLWIEVADLNGDGKLDAVTGQGESGDFTDRLYLGTASAPVDTRAPSFRAVKQLDGTSPVLRFAVVDNSVSDEGPRLQRAFVRVTANEAPTEVDAVFVGGDLFRAVLPGQPEGTTVTYEACAVDQQGNQGCAMPLSYTSGPGTTTGSGGSGGSGSSSGPGSGSGGGGDDDGGDKLEPEDTGCGCAVPGASTGGLGAAWLLAAAAVLRARRRRIG